MARRDVEAKLMLMVPFLLTVAIARISLLLKSGDIEVNPGPGLYEDLDYDHVNISLTLDEDDLVDVMREIMSIHGQYLSLGRALRLKADDLDTIRRENSNDANQALNDVLLLWLRQKYNVKKFGLPTWRMLVQAVDDPAGGNNHALAKKIAFKYPLIPIKPQDSSDTLSTSSSSSGPLLSSGNLSSRQDSFSSPTQREMPVGFFESVSPHSLDQNHKCRETLAKFYQRQPIDDSAQRPVSISKLINLSLVRDDLCQRKTVEGTVDDIVSDREKATYEDIFQKDDVKDGKSLILLVGRPGSGKTTIINEISLDWAKNEILMSEILILVPLKKLNLEQDRSLTTIIKCACPPLQTRYVEHLVRITNDNNGDGIVFAFDGFDEYSSRYDGDIILEIMKGNRLLDSMVIVTSRPAAIYGFRQYAGRQIEVVGFLKPQIFEYISAHFNSDTEKAQKLIAYLKQRCNLMNMCYLPLHCSMLVFLYEELGATLPETDTEFYKHFTISTLLRSFRKRKGRTNIPHQLRDFCQLPSHDKALFDNVCKLAFKATVTSKQSFSFSELKEALLEVGSSGSDETSLGLVIVDQQDTRYGSDETYTFTHLTFQEFLAAVHISGLTESQQMAMINDHGKKRHLAMCWRFLCGVLDYSSDTAMNIFRALIKKAPSKDILFQMQCAHESQQSKACTHIVNSLSGRFEFKNLGLNPSECSAIGFVIKKADKQAMAIMHLIFDRCDFSTDGAKALLQSISECQFTLKIRKGQKAARSFLNALKQYTTTISGLSDLHLEHNLFDDTIDEVLEDSLKHCTNLEGLSLEHNALSYNGVFALGNGLKHCTNLRKLSLKNNNLGPRGVFVLVDGLKGCISLENLKIVSNDIGDSGALALVEGLKSCTNLQLLNLTNNNIGNDGAQALGKGFKTLTGLQHVSLRGNKIGEIGAEILMEGLRCCSNLQHLILQNNSLGEVGTWYVIDGLKHWTSLQNLNLGGVNTGEAIVCALAKELPQNTNLQWLDLHKNSLTDGSILHLIEIIDKVMKLEGFGLYDNDFSESGIEMLKAAAETRNENEAMAHLTLC